MGVECYIGRVKNALSKKVGKEYYFVCGAAGASCVGAIGEAGTTVLFLGTILSATELVLSFV